MDMKPLLINLCVLLVALAVYLWISIHVPALPVPPMQETVEVQVFQPLEAAAPVAEPVFQPLEPRPVVPPVVVIEPKRPVQTLEERGDAMLFEAGALGGTPFDQAVTMPFD
jgi:hypothetical protein